MPIDAFNMQKTKEAIMSFIKTRGPSLPVQIAKDVKTSPLFASAFLSELYNDQKLRMSHMRVGSTPLYLIPGQESQLENFIQYLNHKEREAVSLLKQNSVLDDETTPPAIRVALRELKDFAIPVQENGKLIWKYAFANLQPQISQQQAIPIVAGIPSSIIQATMPQSQTPQQPVQIQQEVPSIKQEIQEIKSVIKEEITQVQEIIEEEKPKIKKIIKKPVQPTIQPTFSLTETPKKIEENPETPFSKQTKHQLKEKGLEILAIDLEKKKEFECIARAKTSFGHQDYYCIAKDKKKLQEIDIPPALAKAQEKRMPVLYLIPGLPDKKTLALLQHWGNLIKFEKL